MTQLKTLKLVALAISIIIVLNAFINIGVKTFYPGPEFEDFCSSLEDKIYNTQQTCEAVGGKWITLADVNVSPEAVAPRLPGEDFKSYCDSTFTCRAEYESVREFYDRNVFVILVVAGLIALGIGYGITSVGAVSSGFIFGGVLSFIIGTIRYWSAMDDYLRFIILGVALIILIWIGYKKLNRD